jgi:hypothetical protein
MKYTILVYETRWLRQSASVRPDARRTLRCLSGGVQLFRIDLPRRDFVAPDREPPRLGSLSHEQEAVVIAFLDVLAFDERSVHKAFAMHVLEEYWIPGALYRTRRPEGA